MSVHLHKRGYWYVSWRDRSGKQRTKSFGRDGESAARAWDEEHNPQHLRTERDGAPTLVELADIYFDGKPDLHPHTKRDILNYLDKYCAEFCDKPVPSLTKADVLTLRTNMGHATNAGKNRVLAYLKAILNYAVEHELIHLNPWDKVKHLTEERQIPTATLADFQTILAHAADHVRWAAAVQFSLFLRAGERELLSLKWESFRWEEGAVYCKQGKTGRIKRVIPSAGFLEEARRRFEVDQENGMAYVIHYAGRAPLGTIKTGWNAAKRRADKATKGKLGLAKKRIRMYDLRHVAISEALARGADPAAVQGQSGHARLSTLLDFYSHVLTGAQRRAAELQPDLLTE